MNNTLDMLKGVLFMFVTLALLTFAMVMAAKIDKTIIDSQEQVDTIQSDTLWTDSILN